MACTVREDFRFQNKIITPAPTAASGADCGAWAATDIMKGEFVFHESTKISARLDDGSIVEIYPGPGSSAAAPDSSVQFNSGGSFAGSADFTFDGSALSLVDKDVELTKVISGSTVTFGMGTGLVGGAIGGIINGLIFDWKGQYFQGVGNIGLDGAFVAFNDFAGNQSSVTCNNPGTIPTVTIQAENATGSHQIASVYSQSVVQTTGGGQILFELSGTPGASGKRVRIADAYNLPLVDGTIDQVVKTDGAGQWGYVGLFNQSVKNENDVVLTQRAFIKTGTNLTATDTAPDTVISLQIDNASLSAREGGFVFYDSTDQKYVRTNESVYKEGANQLRFGLGRTSPTASLHLRQDNSETGHTNVILFEGDSASLPSGSLMNLNSRWTVLTDKNIFTVGNLGGDLFRFHNKGRFVMVDNTDLVYDQHLDLQTDKKKGSLKLPSLTTAQRDLLTNTDAVIVFNNSTGKFQGKIPGGAWVDFH